MNKKITVHNDDAQIEGSFIDIDNDGNAIINTDTEQVSVSTGILKIL